jgi:RNA polymerase sigma-B factor
MEACTAVAHISSHSLASRSLAQELPAPARYRAADALLATMAMCPTQRQRRSLEGRVVALTLGLADSVARRYRGRGVDVDDLTQVARLALLKAVRGYRSGRGRGFAAYAVPTMSGEIKRYFRDFGWAVRPPRRLQEVRARVAEEDHALRQRLQREPSDPELAASLGLSRSELDEARTAAYGYQTCSLDGGPADGVPLEVPDDHDAVDELLTRDALHSALANLSAREQDILHMRFVEERTQSDIGKRIGVSQMHVSRLLAGILTTLRATLTQDDAAA